MKIKRTDLDNTSEVNELLNANPPWIVSKGYLVILFVAASIITFSLLINYTVTIPGYLEISFVPELNKSGTARGKITTEVNYQGQFQIGQRINVRLKSNNRNLNEGLQMNVDAIRASQDDAACIIDISLIDQDFSNQNNFNDSVLQIKDSTLISLKGENIFEKIFKHDIHF